MPYPITSYFKPSDKYLQTWSLVPQVRTISVTGQKAKSLYSGLSPAIPLFYFFMISAIGIDIYLGFSILAKSGVNIGLIIGSVLADLLLAIAPFLIESFMVKDWNHVVVENRILQKRLECQIKSKYESAEEFKTRRDKQIEPDLKKYLSYQFSMKVLRFLLFTLIITIAGWKIYTYYKVLPPGLSIFSMVNGKIVIIFSALCAIFHILGSEKAFAHLMFWFIKEKEWKNFLHINNVGKPNPNSKEIEFMGEYTNASSGNTSVINRDGKVYLEFIHIIKDDEVQELINSQNNDDARRGLAISCKKNQII
jgi:hypothetical protein